MTKEDGINTLVKRRLQQADRVFMAGELLLEQKFYTDCINRFYYSMFYAVTALLLTKDLGSSKHKGVISSFDREFVRTGEFSKELSNWLHSIFEQRLKADYGEPQDITYERATQIKTQASSFVQTVKEYLERIS